MSTAAPGSSPLARGTPSLLPGVPGGTRLIPARAGNTRQIRCGQVLAAAHPRSRGEHFRSSCRSLSVSGSSPLARGTPDESKALHFFYRLIPARAGNTAWHFTYAEALTAHPRSRGEHAARTMLSRPSFGSSPLARGTPSRGVFFKPKQRLIPARAGNTGLACPGRARRSAHPRSRGEHGRSSVLVIEASGSSPLARGTQQKIA